jgi:hypothetical protein
MSAGMLSGGFVNAASEIAIHARGAKLESVAKLTSEWFTRHVCAASRRLIGLSLLDDFVAQLASAGACLRKMSSQYFSDFLDRLDDGVTKFLVPKMRAHSLDKALPEFLTALFMNGLVADDGKLMRARRDEDQHGVPFARLLHSHPMEPFLRRDQRISI